MMIIVLMTLVFYTPSVGAGQHQKSFTSPQLAPEAVMQLAEERAVEEGYKLDGFRVSRLSYDYIDKEWFVIFDEREFTGALGAHFIVQIKEGEEIEVILDRGI